MNVVARLTVILAVAATLAGCTGHKPTRPESTLPPPEENPSTAADIIDNYIFGGRHREMQATLEAAGRTDLAFDIDFATVWQRNPMKVAIFADEPSRSMIVRLLDRYSEVSARNYMITDTEPDILFVVQREVGAFDLTGTMFDVTHIAARLAEPTDQRRGLTRAFVHDVQTAYTQPSGGRNLDTDFTPTEFFGYENQQIVAAVLILDTPAEPDDGTLWRQLNMYLTAILVPSRIDSIDARYRFFNPEAGPETVRAIRAYYAAELPSGVRREVFKERIAAALAVIE